MNNLHSQVIHGLVKLELFVKLLSDKNGYSEPSSLFNYSPKKMTERNWEVISHEDRSEAIGSWIEWEFGGGKSDIYGFFVTNKEGEILWSERSKIPYKVLRKGDKFRVRPKIVLEEQD